MDGRPLPPSMAPAEIAPPYPTGTQGAAGGFLLRGAWSAAETGTSGASGAVAKRKTPREPGVQKHMGACRSNVELEHQVPPRADPGKTVRNRRCPASVTGTNPARSHCSASRNGKAREVGRRKPEDPVRPESNHTLSRERRSDAGIQVGPSRGTGRRSAGVPRGGTRGCADRRVLAGGFRGRVGAGAGADRARRRHGDADRGEGLGAGLVGQRRDEGGYRPEEPFPGGATCLQGIPGVDVQRTGSLGSLENIQIRGGTATTPW